MTLTITDEGPRSDSERGTGVISWTEITGVHEAAHICALKMSGTNIMPIPRETDSGDVFAFIAEVRARTGL